MIEQYTNHAANERTFLAWVRTSISVMAFGFLVEKFDLFLRIAARSSGGKLPGMASQLVGNVVGLILIILGGTMMVLATVRFRKTARDIDAPDKRPDSGGRVDVVLASMLVLLGSALFVYMVYTLVSKM